MNANKLDLTIPFSMPETFSPYSYTYEVQTISFQTFFIWVFKIVVDSWKFTMLLLYLLWDDWPIFMISGSNQQLQHPTKAWLSQLVNFKNAIWTWGHFRRTICNKILFSTWKQWCHRNVWNASDCFSTILHKPSISFWVS